MRIDWGAFGEVFVVSFGVAVGLIVLFAVGVTLLSPTPAPNDTHLALADTDGTTRTTPRPARPNLARQVAAWLCFLACALSVTYALHIIIAK